MEQTLMDKLTILADSAKYDVACTSSGAPAPRGGTVWQLLCAGLLPRLYRRWPLCQPAEGAHDQLLRLRLQLLRQPPLQRYPPRHLYAPGAGRADHEFYRRNYIEGLFLSSAVLGNPGLHHRADAGSACGCCGNEYRFGGLHPRQGHPRHQPGTAAAAGLSGRPSERERGAAQRAQPEPAGPGQGAALHFPPHEADRGIRRRQPGGAYPLPPRAQSSPPPGRAPR